MKQLIITLGSFFLFFIFCAYGLERAEVDQLRDEVTQMAASLKGEYSSVHLYQSLESGEDSEYIARWYQKNREFQDKFDQYILKKQEYMMSFAHQHILEELASLDEKTLNKYKDEKDKLIEYYGQWFNYKDVIGTAEQKYRKYPMEYYFREAQDLFKKLGHDHRKLCSRFEGRGLPEISEQLSGLTGLIGRGCQSLFRVFKNRDRTIGDTPLTVKFNKLFQNYGQKNRFTFNLQGSENLPDKEIRDDKEVYLVLPTHHHPLIDTILMAGIDLPHYLLFFNPKGFLPAKLKWLADKLCRAVELIAVGPWRGKENKHASEKVIESLSAQYSNVIFNYAQGFTAMFNEILPVRLDFDEALLENLISHGYKLNIVPVVYEVPASFLSADGVIDERSLEAKVLKPISSQSSDFLLSMEKNGHPQLMATILRSIWLDNTTKYPEMELDDILKRIARHLSLHCLECSQS